MMVTSGYFWLTMIINDGYYDDYYNGYYNG